MAAIVNALSRASGTQTNIEPVKTTALKAITMFCGVGLTVWFLLASYGLDLSAGFF